MRRPPTSASTRARLRYRLPREASCEADDLRLYHLDIAGMDAAERWGEGARVIMALARLAPAGDLTIMRRGVPCSARAWLLERLRLLDVDRPATGALPRG
jgi:hypothetical protein